MRSPLLIPIASAPVGRRVLLTAVVLCAATPASASRGRQVTKLADGVYAIAHAEREGGASGNTAVIIGDRQVLVVDTCFLPSEAREDIADVRRLTSKPVTYVLNTHFHNDHNLGNRAYLDAFPAVTIIAQVETKKDMDRFGPGSADRLQRGMGALKKMLETGKTPDGTALTSEDTKQVRGVLAARTAALTELEPLTFQSATLTFDGELTIDLGHRVVELKFLGRGNTAGDAVAYLPREKIVITGDLVVSPIPYFSDGYPREWIQTLSRVAALDAAVVVPGHGLVMRDKQRILLIRDLLQSVVDQLDARLVKIGPAMSRTMDEVRDGVDVSAFRQRFAGHDRALGEAFDQAMEDLVNLALREASLR